ncbi:MAG: site-2 protease family protein [Clostridiales bacterium]|nr:site-2 protease family protein [Clostridiales bacterium]
MHPAVLALVALLSVQGRLYALLLCTLALVIHECAHALVARRLGLDVMALTLLPFGAQARLEANACLPSAEALVVMAGPIASLVAAGLSQLCARTIPAVAGSIQVFSEYNLFLALVNLLPAYPLDGGRLLRCLLSRRLRPRLAASLTAWIGIALGCLTLALALLGTLLYYSSLTLYMVGVFLLLAAGKELLALPDAQLNAMLRRSASLRRGEPVRVRYSVVHAALTAGEAMRLLRQHDYTLLRVVDDRMRALGEIDESTLLAGLGALGAAATVGQILTFDPSCDRILLK